MSTYRYSVVVDVDINTSKASKGPTAVNTAFSEIEKQAEASAKKSSAQFEMFNDKLGKSTQQIGIWQRAFQGAFIGAVAGMAFSTIISGVTGIGDAVFRAGENAVKAAAQYQLQANSLSVFSGSLSAARGELAEMDKLARNTPGLRMEDAEQGAVRLRALGFEAKVTQDLVVGLAKEKLMSGADEQAMNRVIVNIMQLATGSTRVTQDIKEMVLAMPTMKNALVDTFGSMDKFKASLAKDPQGTFKIFAEGLKNVQVAQPGFTDAVGKMEDAWITAGRAFGEPLLDPLTKDIKDLTSFVYDNRDTWKSWGQDVADTVRGVSDAIRDLKNLDSSLGPPSSGTGHDAATGVGTAGKMLVLGPIWEAMDAARMRAAMQRGWEEQAALQKSIANEPNLRTQMYGADFIGPVSEDMRGEATAQRRAKDQADAQIREVNRKAALESTKRWIGETNEAIKAGTAQETAIRGIAIRNTTAQEIQYQKDIAQIKEDGIKKEWSAGVKSLDAQISLTSEGTEEQKNLISDRTKFITQKNSELVIAEAEAQKQMLELQRKANEERRRDLIEANDIELRASKSLLDARTFDTERMISRTGAGYDRLVDIARDDFAKTSQIISENFALQIQNETLTTQQRVNLERQANLDIQDAAEAHRRKLLEISDRQDAQRVQRLTAYIDRVQSLFGVDIAGMQGLQGAFSNNALFGASLPDIGLTGAYGIKNSGIVKDSVTELEGGKITLYQAQYNLLDQIQKKQAAMLDSELQGKRDLLDIKRYGSGTADELSDLNSQIRLLENKKQILAVDQAIEANNLKLSTDVETINDWTQKIASGKRDSVLHALEEVDLAKQYEDVVIASRTQIVLMNDAKLVGQSREIEHLKAVNELRQDELNAVYAIDKAQLSIDNKLVYSKNRADAAVLNFLAQQKGITDIVSDTKINLMTTAYSGLDAVATRLTRSFGAFRDVAKDLLANLLKLALNSVFGKLFGGSNAGGGGFPAINFGGGGSSSGGGINFGNIISGGFGSGGGIGGTPNFGTGLTTSGAGGAFTTADAFGAVGGGQSGGGGLLGSIFGSSAGGGGSLLGGLTGAASGFLAGLPIFGAGIGSSLGGMSTGGRILGGLGGALGGIAALGGLLTLGAGTGLAAGVGGLLGAGLTGGLLAAAPFAAIAAPLLIVGALLLKRNAQRRAEEGIRNQAMLDAFAGLDKLISDVNSDKIDGASALDQANTIRSNYLTQMSQLKDKKTRNIALADVSRIDAKISLISQATDAQQKRKDRLELMVPTFATGGAVSPGYQYGLGSATSDSMMGYFPASGTMARYSAGEYILDAQTTSNVGVAALDTLRATKGQSMRDRLPVMSYAQGGQVITPSIQGGGNMTSGPVTLELHLNVGLATEDFANVVSASIKDNNGSREQLSAIVNLLKNLGAGNPLTNTVKDQITGR